MSEEDIQVAPPPWQLKGTVYVFAFRTTPEQVEAATAAGIAYSPLEAGSSFTSPAGSKPAGGLSMIQIIRYDETPVGPYDELVIAPGFHEYVVEQNGKHVKKKNARITRIYVSQKHTCWNGRKNWNIPKHLASFSFKETSDGIVNIQVFANDTAGVASESAADNKPFFQASFKPVPYVPQFPTSTRLLKFVGVDPTLVQPPLPEGKGSQGELPGTDQWCEVVPVESSLRTSLGWFDVQQIDRLGDEVDGKQEANFWPGVGRWHLGARMKKANLTFGEGLYWDPPTSVQ